MRNVDIVVLQKADAKRFCIARPLVNKKFEKRSKKSLKFSTLAEQQAENNLKMAKSRLV